MWTSWWKPGGQTSCPAEVQPEVCIWELPGISEGTGRRCQGESHQAAARTSAAETDRIQGARGGGGAREPGRNLGKWGKTESMEEEGWAGIRG